MNVKTKAALLLTGLAFAPLAHAGLFNIFRGIPMAPEAIDTPEERAAIAKLITPLVPVKADCQPAFTPGNDGLFRRTPYCHKANPIEPNGFLQLGHDVPATFLKGFTEADALERWKDAHFEVPNFLGSKVEVPTELFTALNVNAAQSWERLLACANGDADRARELYRTGAFGCSEETLIRSRINDVRQSLRTLAASIEIATFLDRTRMDERLHELAEKRRHLYEEVGNGHVVGYMERSWAIEREENAIYQLRLVGSGPLLIEHLGKLLPKMPRMHPLLTQILIEEILSFTAPEENPKAITRRLHKDRALQVTLMQLLLWMHSIEDHACAPLGLWPSANRAAMETFADRGIEIANQFDKLKREVSRNFHLVQCPMDPNRKPYPERDEDDEPRPRTQGSSVMRLDEIYTQGELNIWRELLQVRSLYITPTSK
jgi:hypothetical protein